MKKNKIVILIIVGVIALFSISTITISIKRNEDTINISSSWSNVKAVDANKNSNDEFPALDIPIVVVYKEKKVGDINSQNPLIIDISDEDFGKLWVPIVKKSDYDFSVTVKDMKEIKVGSVKGRYVIDGEIKVSGENKLLGTYTIKEAKNVVVDKVLKKIYDEAKKNMK